MINPIVCTRTRRPQDYVEPHLLLHVMYLPAGVAYNGHTQLVDGTTYSFSRRERPHLVFRRPSDDSGAPLPIAITNGVQYGHGDQTTTLLQPLNTVASKTDDVTPMITTSKCTRSYNCSLNGYCNVSGLWVCDQGWSGHLVMAADGRTLAALTTGTMDSPTNPYVGAGSDSSYTMLQRIRAKQDAQ
jgi:hypothetical protein